MNSITRNLSLMLLLALIASCGGSNKSNQVSSSSSFSSSSAGTTKTLTEKIDEYLAVNQQSDQPGVSILVLKDGKLAYSGGKGMADIPSGVAIASTTGFRLASVSKPFTAIAIMKLVEQKELKVSDSILDYIPELPQSWQKITIEHLLTHSSGIYDIINDGWKPTVLNGMNHTTLINYLINNPALEFEPGTRFDYCNTGYMLLATIIERKTNLKFSEYMQSNIFGPANMRDSYINDENQPIKYGDALNYARLRTFYGIITNLKGSMAQVSSRDDFFNFFAAMRENKIVSAETFAAIITPRGNLDDYITYGYGFVVLHDLIGHNGLWDGFETEVYIGRKNSIEFAILTNSGPAGGNHIKAIRNIILTSSF